MDDQKRNSKRSVIRNLLIEMVVYGGLLAVYFYVALQFLSEPLTRLFDQNLTAYAAIGLALIVGQAVLLEFVVSFLFDFLGLHRLTSKVKKP